MHKRRLSDGCRRSPLIATLSGFVCAAVAFLTTGCQDEKIETHHVPKPADTVRLLAVMVPETDLDRVWFFKLEGPIEKVDAHAEEFDRFVESIRFTRGSDDGLRWKVPPGWTEEEGSGLRKRTLIIGKKSDDLAVSVTSLSQMAGDVPMNVNRWRKQVGLTSLPASETFDTTTSCHVGGLAASKVDLKGPGNPLAKSPQSAKPLGEDKGPNFNYQVPEGWMKSPKNITLAIATFIPKKQDNCLVTVTPTLPKEESEKLLLNNINRWRRQVGLTAVADEKEAQRTAKTVKVGNEDCLLYDMSGTPPTEDGKEGPKPRRILAVPLKRGKLWWFFKMSGSPSEVGAEEKAFEEFLGSMRFESDKEPHP
jgi:hypothetical protein